MEHLTFDRLTRLVAASGSRRTAWRALLGAALLGATTKGAAAAPCGPDQKNRQCRCGVVRDCTPGTCFTHECGHQFCCTEPEWIICGNACCANTRDGCRGVCIHPILPEDFCESGITGTYRRR